MSKLIRLRKSRTAMRRMFTLTMKKLEESLVGDDVDIIQVSAQLEVINTYFLNLNEANSSIYELLLENDEVQDEEIDEELQMQNEYSLQYHTICKRFDKLKDNVKVSEEGKSQYCGSVISRGNCSVLDKARHSYKLPQLKFKEFSGELGEWLPFWSQFRKIDEDKTMDPADKIQYLVMATTAGSPARELVDSYPATPEMYYEVVHALKHRFGRDDLLKEYYMRQLLSLAIQNVTNSEKPLLAVLYDKIQSHLRNLHSLGVTSELCASLLLPMVTSSLPEDILKLWQRTTNQSTEKRDSSSKEVLENILVFLKNEVEGQQKVSMALEGFGVSYLTHKGNNTRKTPSKTVANNSNMLYKQENEDIHSHNPKEKISSRQPSAAALVTMGGSNNLLACVFCDKNHSSQDCLKALDMSLSQRRDILKKKGACYKCLKCRHMSNSCRALVKCAVCLRKHYPIMCDEISKKPNDFPKVESSKVASGPSQTLLSSNQTSSLVYLNTLVVKLVVGTQEYRVRVLVDSGSQKSYILKSCVTALNLKRLGKTLTSQELFGGQKTSVRSHGVYSVKLKSINDSFEEEFKVLDTSRICGYVPSVTDVTVYEFLKEKGMILSDYCKPSEEVQEVQLLLGADSWAKIITSEFVKIHNELVAVKTKLGWSLIGESNSNSKMKVSSTMLLTLTHQVDISHFWELELLGIRDPGMQKAQSEKDCEVAEFFEKTVNQEESGRYTVQLPWIEEQPVIQDNKSLAEKRLYSTTNKLKQIGKYDDYNTVFQTWLDLEIIEKVDDTELNNVDVHYLPHRAVLKENSTTQVRPVFDASAVDRDGHSLNNSMERGPNLIELIPTILIKFRLNEIGIIADIEKAFLQISIQSNDRDWLRFIWWDNGKKVVFRHRRVVFGLSSSPFLLGAVLAHHLKKATGHMKETAEKLTKSLYVDNCVTSVKCEKELDKFVSESQELLSSACFNLRGWISNVRNPDTEEHVLGLKWTCGPDLLSCNIKLMEGVPTALTRRTLLSMAQRVFDPIGFTAAVSVTLKIILQKSWDRNKNWDDPLPDDLAKDFKKWFSQVHFLGECKIPRRIYIVEGSSVHVFCDASKLAYACCIFVRTKTTDGIKLSLLMAKSRVAPTKILTLPRLELMAALIGVRLFTLVIQGIDIKISDVTFWSDSAVVLTWINKRQKWSVFVENRINEIISVTSPQQWRHVPGTENPADLLSRGCMPFQFMTSRWWEGPKWLMLPECDWPVSEVHSDPQEVNKEIKKTGNVVSLVVEERVFTLSSLAKSMDRYPKIVRTVARSLDFICLMTPRFNEFCGLDENTILDLCVTSEKYCNAEIVLIRSVQREYFKTEKGKNTLKCLNFYEDDRGLVHLQTRLMEGEDSPNFVSPIFLPSSHPIVEKLIEHEHVKHNHAGVLTLILILRERFWIPQCRRKVKTIVHRCLTCRKQIVKPLDVPVPPLPRDRTQNCPVFHKTGVDLMGPLITKTSEKCWVVIFTCAVYRAVHLELLASLSTSALIQALRRFISRRGRPHTLQSDNGTNFVGLDNALKHLDWTKIEEECGVQRIKWKFNVPSAPWWGGYWERLIRVLKDLLRKNLGRASLSHDEIYTLLCECECLMNSRPLTYVGEDPNELTPLTPSLFLTSLPSSGVRDLDELDTKSIQKRLRFIQKLREGLRSRFQKEYLGFLRSAKQRRHDTLKIGDVVLVGSERKRLNWILARVAGLIPGRDGVVRLVRLKTANSEILRPIQRLYPLEINTHDETVLEEERKSKNNLDIDKSANQGDNLLNTPDLVKTRSGRMVKSREVLDF